MSLASALIKVWNDCAAALASSGYAFFTIEANIVCIIILGVLFFRQQTSSDQTEAGVIWVKLLLVQIIYCLSWIFRVLSDASIFPDSLAAQYTFAAVNMSLFSLTCWQIFMYSELSQKSELLTTFSSKALSAIPLAFNVVMLIFSPFTGFYWDISDGMLARGRLYFLMLAVSVGYPVLSVVITLLRRQRMSRYERGAMPLAAVCAIAFVVFGLLQAVNWKIPILCYVMVIADIFVHLSYADSLVSVDPLTQIPNRNGLFRRLSQRLGQADPDSLHVFAVDVDDLKGINSQHGRTEGDHALIITAEALKKFCAEEHPCEVYRYHGDEFIIVADIHDKEELELFVEHIRNYVSNAAISHRLPYHLRVSIGWSKYEQFSRMETVSGLIDEAVRALIERKEQKKFQAVWQRAGQE